MRRDTWLGRNAGKLIAFLILLLVSVLMLLPIIWGVFGSFRDYNDFNLHASSFFPSNWDAFTFDGYAELFSKTEFIPSQANEYYPIWNWLFNSLIVAIGGTLLYLLIASLAAYAFVFLDFKYSNRIFYFLIGTMTIPGIISTAPQLINMNMLGFYKSLMGLIAPSLGGVYGVFLIRQFFLSIPSSIRDSAAMDGASDRRYIISILIPISRAVISTLLLQSFVSMFNSYLWPLLVTNRTDMRTVQIGITMLGYAESLDYGPIFAAIVIVLIPFLAVFILMHRRIMASLRQGYMFM